MDFLVDNYIWLLILGIVIIMALIGYIAERTEFGKIEKPKEADYDFGNDEILKKEIEEKRNKSKEPKKSRKEIKEEKKRKKEEARLKKEEDNLKENKKKTENSKKDKKDDKKKKQEVNDELKLDDPIELEAPSLDEVANMNVGLSDAISKTQQLNSDDINKAKDQYEQDGSLEGDKLEEPKLEEDLKAPLNLDEVVEKQENTTEASAPDEAQEDLKVPLNLDESIKEDEPNEEQKVMDEVENKIKEKEDEGLDLEKTVDLSEELGGTLEELESKAAKKEEKEEGMEEFKI